MNGRHLFLVGYDISQNRNRRRTLKDVKGHALGGQKSFYECWLTVGDLHELMAQLKSRIDFDTDKIIFVRLDARNQSICLGQAEQIHQGDYFQIT
jgi:CRISPR-associated protein Cas2